MVFRRIGDDEQQKLLREDDDGLNITSGDDEDNGEERSGALFEPGQSCDVCGAEDGRVGLDPTCRGAYDGDPVFYGLNCLEAGLKAAYGAVEGVAVVVESFGDFSDHYYYRLDEMPAYQFVRDDVESVSWLLLTIGGSCGRCGEQSHFAWLTRDFVDPALPENEPVFRNMDKDTEHLCGACTGAALALSYRSLDLPLMTVELPRSAMGIVMPTGD